MKKNLNPLLFTLAWLASVWSATAQTVYVSPPYIFSTLAGTAGSFGSADGTGGTARFALPSGLAVDSAGNLYVGDLNSRTIRKITPAGEVTTLAGSPGLSGGTDGTGSAARFDSPSYVALDSASNVYVADYFTIRKITPAGEVTTLAGSPGLVGSTDGTGSAARFGGLLGVGLDTAGNVYVADSGSGTIRKITPAGVVTTLAGSPGLYGSTDGTGNAARFGSIWGLAVDSANNIYVADYSYGTIRKITPVGEVTTLAGSPGIYGSTDGTGSAARLRDPLGVAVDNAGNVYVTELSTHTIRKITPAGVVTTLAGSPGNMGSADGMGSDVRFKRPRGVAVDSAGNIYVADTENFTIRKGVPSVAPAITVPPASHTADFGSSTSFSVTATGTAPFSYQWRKSGTNLSGVTAQTLSFNPAAIADTGDYDVVITNIAGSVTSIVATLTVNRAVQSINFAPIADVYQCRAPFTLTATASSGLPLSYTSSDPDVATVSGNTVTVVGPGTTYITAEQPGDSNYLAAISIYETLTVTASPSVTAAGLVCANSAGNAASVADGGPGVTYAWTISNGTIPSPFQREITYTAGPSGIVTLNCTVVRDNSCFSTASAFPSILPLPDATITASNGVCADSPGNVAAVPDAGLGATYAWTIGGGTITAGAGTRQITFTAGAASQGQVSLHCMLTAASGCSSAGSANVIINSFGNANGGGGGITNVVFEDFGTGGPEPDGWSFLPAWMIATDPGFTYPGASGGNCAQSVPAPVGAFYLSTKSYDCSGLSNLKLSFAVLRTSDFSSSLLVEASSDGGATWPFSQIVLYADIPDTGGQVVGPYALGAGFDGSSQVIFRFQPVLDSSGNVAIDDVKLTGTLPGAVPTVSISASGSTTICPGTGVQLTASLTSGSGYTYIWSPSTGLSSPTVANPIATPAATTTYTVTVLDAHGCAVAASTTITLLPQPSAGITTAASTCSLRSGNMASVPDGGAGVTYAWTISNGTITNSPSARVIYYTAGPSGTVSLGCTVTITATGCSAVGAAFPIINPVPNPSISASSSTCANSPGNAASVPDAGAGATYVWVITNGTITAGTGTRLITYTAGPPSAGTVGLQCTVTTSAGCSSYGLAGVIISTFGNGIGGGGPAPLLSEDFSSAAGTTPPAGWSLGSGWTFSPVPPFTYGGSGGNFARTGAGATAFLTSRMVDCTGLTSVQLSLATLRTGPFVRDLVVEASFNGGSTWPYSQTIPNASIPTTGGLVSGPFTLGAQFDGSPQVLIRFRTSGTGPGTVSIDDVVMTATAAASTPTVSISPGGPTTICQGSSVQLTASVSSGAGYSYSWSPATGLSSTTVANPTATPSTSTTYTVTVADTHGCTATTNRTVTVNPAPTIANAGADQSVCGLVATLAGNAPTVGSGNWSKVNGPGTVTFGNDGADSPTATATVSVAGAYVFRWTVHTAACGDSTDDVQLTYSQPASVTAGPDQLIQAGGTVALAGSFGGGAASATWSGGGGFSPNNSALNATYTPSGAEVAAGVATLTLTTDDPSGECPAVSDVMIVSINHPPTPANTNYTHQGLPLKIKVAGLLAMATDPDAGDTVVFRGINAGVQGATITTNGGYIFYTPANNNDDTLVYTVGDNRGGTGTANILITVGSVPASAAASISTSGGEVTVIFHGIPGYRYDVQRSANPQMIPFELIRSNITADATGRIIVTESLNSGSFFFGTNHTEMIKAVA